MFDKLNGGINPATNPNLYMLDWIFEHDTLEFRAKCRVLGLKHDVALRNLAWDDNSNTSEELAKFNEAYGMYRYFVTNFGGQDEPE